jgi:hypothetical protein
VGEAVLHVGGGITFGPLRHLVRRVLGGSGVGHDGGGRALSVWWRCMCVSLFVRLLLGGRSWARAQADCKDEQRGKEAIKHVKVLLAGGVDAGTQRVVRQGDATTSGRAGLQID